MKNSLFNWESIQKVQISIDPDLAKQTIESKISIRKLSAQTEQIYRLNIN